MKREQKQKEQTEKKAAWQGCLAAMHADLRQDADAAYYYARLAARAAAESMSFSK